jgi:predicted nucleic acid-binding protein
VAVLVDTSAWIEFFKPRGAEVVRRAVQEALGEGLVVSVAPVLAELLVGLQPARSGDAKAIDLLRSLPIVDLTWDVCGRAGEMGRATARKGQRVPTIDLLIAAAALSENHEVWHAGDQHFVLLEQAGGLRQRNC